MRSALLVLGQFTCIAVLLFGGAWDLPWWAWALFLTGLSLFAWAAVSLGKKNFTILPEPKAGNELSIAGIYRSLRHPMYTAVLSCGTAVTFGAPSLWRWIALVTCLVVLVLKVRYEERALSARYVDYAQRMNNVPRLLPFIW